MNQNENENPRKDSITQNHDRESIREVSPQNLLKALNELSIIAFTDTKGNITHVNDKFCEISGYSREELLGQNHRILKSGHHPKEFYKNLWKTISSGKVWTGEIKNLSKRGQYYWVFTTIVPFLDANNKPYQYAAIRIDITQRKIAEDERDQALQEKTKAKMQQSAYVKFVSTLVHDLRNPLMVASLSADLIRRKMDQPEVIKNLAAKIGEKLRFADEMIQSVLDENRIKDGVSFSVTVSEFNAREVIQLTIDDLIVIYGNRFILHSDNNIFGHWSKSAIRRIIENLCTNAIKYGEPGSKVSIDIKKNETSIEVSVHNDGKPIPAEDLKLLFEHYHRAHAHENCDKQGWGIGLAVVQGMTNALGGTVRAKSNNAEGTTFTVHLPIDSRPFLNHDFQPDGHKIISKQEFDGKH